MAPGGRSQPISSAMNSENWSFAINQSPPILQGDPVPPDGLPGVSFAGGSATTCTCAAGGTCSFPLTADTVAYQRLVARMQQIQPRLGAQDVSVEYAWSGLGYSGDPNGPDVSPTVTVRIDNLGFRPLFPRRSSQHRDTWRFLFPYDGRRTGNVLELAMTTRLRPIAPTQASPVHALRTLAFDSRLILDGARGFLLFRD